MLNMSFLSIVVPVFNAERYLPESLGSLLPTLRDDWELIVVDDGSSDNSLELCRKLTANRPNCRMLTQPNGGPGRARNRGLDAARGEYITFLDADDVFAPGTLEHAAEALRESTADLTLLPVARIRAGAGPEPLVRIADERRISGADLRSLWCAGDARIKGYAGGKIYRKEILTGCRFPEDMRFAEDMYFLADVLDRVHGVWLDPHGFYGYCERADTPTTGAWTVEKSRQLLRAYLHRWQCAEAGGYPLRDRIHAFLLAAELLIAERKTFPHDDWSGERAALRQSGYRLGQCLAAAATLRKKIAALHTWMVL